MPLLVDMLLQVFLIILVLQVTKIGLSKIIINLDIQLRQVYGENPLPISQFDEIYRNNSGILVLGAVLS